MTGGKPEGPTIVKREKIGVWPVATECKSFGSAHNHTNLLYRGYLHGSHVQL